MQLLFFFSFEIYIYICLYRARYNKITRIACLIRRSLGNSLSFIRYDRLADGHRFMGRINLCLACRFHVELLVVFSLLRYFIRDSPSVIYLPSEKDSLYVVRVLRYFSLCCSCNDRCTNVRTRNYHLLRRGASYSFPP